MEILEGIPGVFLGAKFGGLEASDDVLQGGGHQEVLLLQAQFLALEEVVVGVEHSGDVLGIVPVNDSINVVTSIDCSNTQ